MRTTIIRYPSLLALLISSAFAWASEAPPVGILPVGQNGETAVESLEAEEILALAVWARAGGTVPNPELLRKIVNIYSSGTRGDVSFWRGLVYEKIESRQDLARECYEESLATGSKIARPIVGLWRVLGIGGERNVGSGLAVLQEGQREIDPACIHNLGVVYWSGIEGAVAPNKEYALAAWKTAALLGNMESGYVYGNLAASGAIEDLRPGVGVGLLVGAATRGHGLAAERLATLFLRGADGVKRNPEEAVYWGRIALGRGRIDAGALVGGALLLLGKREEAMSVVEQSAIAGSSEAMYLFGLYLAVGIGGNRDIDRARDFLQRAVKAGHVSAEDALKKLNSGSISDDSVMP